MKILYVANARIPTEKAHGTQIVNMCSAFAELGNDLTLLVPERENPITQDTFEYYKVDTKFKIERIHNFNYFKWEKYIGKLAFYLESLSFFVSLSLLKVEKDTLVYTRNPELVWLFSQRGFNVAYECHDWFKKNKNLALFFLKKVRYLITTNSFIKEEFVKNGFDDSRIMVAPNGVSTKIFDLPYSKEEAIEKLDIRDDLKKRMRENKVLLYTGSFKTMGVEKGIRDIVDALTNVTHENVLFIAVGGSVEDVKFYTQYAEEKGIMERAVILDRREQSELALFQKGSDILLMPFPDLAHYKYHMAPLKMFEYLLSKRPIIASSLPSIKEVLNESNCLFCEPGNALDLSQKITYLLENKSFGDAIAAQAFEDAKNYSWKNRAKKIIHGIT